MFNIDSHATRTNKTCSNVIPLPRGVFYPLRGSLAAQEEGRCEKKNKNETRVSKDLAGSCASIEYRRPRTICIYIFRPRTYYYIMYYVCIL